MAVNAPTLHDGQKNCTSDFSAFAPFVTEGTIRLVSSAKDVPVKILCDTGSSETFVLESVLPFSTESYTGSNVLTKGIALNVMSVPLHKLVLQSDLIQGEVEVAVRSCLPVEGVQVILGNDLAGERVWRDDLPHLVVTSSPMVFKSDGDENSLNALPSCVITRSMRKTQADDKLESKVVSKTLEIPSVLSVSRDDLIKEQKADSTLVELFDRIVPYDTVDNLSSGYYLDEGLLVRKWVPYGEFAIGDPVLQIVIPQSLCQLVLQTAHDTSGHMGVKKMYKLLLKRFFWPKLKHDVSKYIKFCHRCQLTGKPNQSLKPAPLYPIPVISQPFEHLIVDCVGPLPRSKAGNAKFVSKFDLLKGYWQVPLTARAREISAFITPSGLFSYKVMSFGLRNAPATFQRLMNRVISGLSCCAVYLDDVAVFSQTWEEHLIQIRALFDRFVKANLTVNLLKCEFARATVTYLGKVVGQGQVRPIRAKVEAIDEYPTPTMKKELMQFLGMVGFYHHTAISPCSPRLVAHGS